MKNINKNKRYIYDPLYGIIYLPEFIWDVIPCPELQRLREVRLCNINSFCLTGGANINRYEHAIGTCHLAQECLNSWPLLNRIDKKEEKQFLLAALLHDVTSAAFGHSVEYIESQEGFDHEKAFEYVVAGEKGGSYQYKSASLEPIFFGMSKELSSKIHTDNLREIGETIKGKGRLGPLISSIMDLDNIDNVFRLAYHIGIVKSGDIPIKLAKSIWVEHGKLMTRKETVPLIEEWYKTRKNLYSYLLLNPEEFSAKCMLSEAIELAKAKSIHPFNWYDLDYELLEKLSKVSSESSEITSRLMKGALYGCIGIFSTPETTKYQIFVESRNKKQLTDELRDVIRSKFSSRFKSAMVTIHPIRDENKIARQVCIQTDDGETVTVGKSSNQLLIGVFFKNVDLNMYEVYRLPDLQKIREEVRKCISRLGQLNLHEIELYSEVNCCE
jgi:HD superfamily phosphohydrolase